MKRLVIILVVSFGLSACESDTPISSDSPQSSEINVSVAGDFDFLPYGEPAPDVLPPNTIPQPYNRLVHGPPKPNSTPHLNLPPDERTRRSSSASPTDGGSRTGLVPAQGSTIKKKLEWFDSSYKGYFANNQLATDLTVPQGIDNVIFAPTAMATNGCIEMSTTHRHDISDSTGTRHLAGWWNWCIFNPEDSLNMYPPPEIADVEEDMTNSTWQNFYTYTSIYDNNKYFTIEIIHDDSQGYDCWNGLLYNYNFGYWESKFYSCYPSGRNGNNHGSSAGWSMWEGRGEIEKQCQNNYRGTRARTVMVHSPLGGWEDVNVIAPSFLDGTMCWAERSDWVMDYDDTGSGSTWHAKTPYSD